MSTTGGEKESITGTKSTAAAVAVGMTGVIEEEDEEMYEHAEEEAEKAAMDAALMARRKEEALRQQWDNVSNIVATESKQGIDKANEIPQEESTEMGYDEACEALGGKYLTQNPQSQATAAAEGRSLEKAGGGGGGGSSRPSSGRAVKSLLVGLLSKSPPRLDPTLEAERHLVLCLSEEHYTPTDPIHLKAIRRLYHGLTSQRNCPITGSHWEEIGFQGADPSTDLNRSMGIWSVLQALYFLETQPALCLEAMQTSIDSVAHWPFMLVSIGFTRQVRQQAAGGVLRDRENPFLSFFIPLFS